MSTIRFNLGVQNAFGLGTSVVGEFELTSASPPPLPPVIDSVVVSPASGPPGTVLTITVNAHDQNEPPAALVYFASVTGPGFDLIPTELPNVFMWQV